MMIVPAGVKVHLALGYTDMRKGMDGLAMLVQETLKKGSVLRPSVRLQGQTSADRQGPVLGRQRAVLVHQAARSGWVRVAADDGARRQHRLVSRTVGIDWRAPERIWRPALARWTTPKPA